MTKQIIRQPTNKYPDWDIEDLNKPYKMSPDKQKQLDAKDNKETPKQIKQKQ